MLGAFQPHPTCTGAPPHRDGNMKAGLATTTPPLNVPGCAAQQAALQQGAGPEAKGSCMCSCVQAPTQNMWGRNIA